MSSDDDVDDCLQIDEGQEESDETKKPVRSNRGNRRSARKGSDRKRKRGEKSDEEIMPEIEAQPVRASSRRLSKRKPAPRRSSSPEEDEEMVN